jgi:hypothetical protein
VPTIRDCAYVAGFFDGEGCVYIAHDKKGRPPSTTPVYNLGVVVGQDDPATLFWLRERWGGSVTPRKQRPNGKRSHEYRATSLAAYDFLSEIIPFLQLKRQQAEVAIDFQCCLRFAIPNPEKYEELAGYRQEVLRLNELSGRPNV